MDKTEHQEHKGRTEPDAGMRRAAAGCWQMFVALTGEGFTDSQALAIIGHMLSGAKGQSQ